MKYIHYFIILFYSPILLFYLIGIFCIPVTKGLLKSNQIKSNQIKSNQIKSNYTLWVVVNPTS